MSAETKRAALALVVDAASREALRRDEAGSPAEGDAIRRAIGKLLPSGVEEPTRAALRALVEATDHIDADGYPGALKDYRDAIYAGRALLEGEDEANVTSRLLAALEAAEGGVQNWVPTGAGGWKRKDALLSEIRAAIAEARGEGAP